MSIFDGIRNGLRTAQAAKVTVDAGDILKRYYGIQVSEESITRHVVSAYNSGAFLNAHEAALACAATDLGFLDMPEAEQLWWGENCLISLRNVQVNRLADETYIELMIARIKNAFDLESGDVIKMQRELLNRRIALDRAKVIPRT